MFEQRKKMREPNRYIFRLFSNVMKRIASCSKHSKMPRKVLQNQNVLFGILNVCAQEKKRKISKVSRKS